MKIPSSKPEEKPTTGPIPYISTTKRDLVEVPWGQAWRTGGLAGGGVAFATAMIFWIAAELGEAAPLRIVALVTLLLGGLVFIPVTYSVWTRTRLEFFDVIRDVLLADVNRNGIPDALEPRSATLYVTMARRRDPAAPKMFPLEYAERIPALARAILIEKKDPTFGNFGGEGLLFTRPEWENLVGELLKNGLAVKVNPNQTNSPIVLTADCRDLLQSVMEQGSRIEVEVGKRQPLNIDHYVGFDGSQPNIPPPSPTNGKRF